MKKIIEIRGKVLRRFNIMMELKKQLTMDEEEYWMVLKKELMAAQ